MSYAYFANKNLVVLLFRRRSLLLKFPNCIRVKLIISAASTSFKHFRFNGYLILRYVFVVVYNKTPPLQDVEELLVLLQLKDLGPLSL
jgi:hypothetical protein